MENNLDITTDQVIANRFCVSIGPLCEGYTLIWHCFNSPLDKHNVNELATPTNEE